MAQGDIRYVITVDSTGATTKIQDFDKAIESLTKTTPKAASAFSGMWKQFAIGQLAMNAMNATWRAFKDVVGDSIQAAIDQENADKALASALESTGRSVQGNIEHYKAFAEAQQKVTVYGDEQIQQAQALMIQLARLDQEGMDKATKGAMGLASVMGIDLESAATLVGKAMAGSAAGLSRYGIVVEEGLGPQEKQAAILDKLLPMYQRSQAEVNTFGGSMKQLKNFFGEVEESVGGAIVGNKDLRKTITDMAEKMQKVVESDRFKLWVSGLSEVISTVVTWTGKLAKGIVDIEDKLFGAKGWDKYMSDEQRAHGLMQEGVNMIHLRRRAIDSDIVSVKEWGEIFKKYGSSNIAVLKALAEGKEGEAFKKLVIDLKAESEALAKAQSEKLRPAVNEVGNALGTSAEAAKASSDAAKKLQQTIQGLIDQADPLRTKSHGLINDMILIDAAFKTGAISSSNYGKVMDWLQAQLRNVEKQALKVGLTALPQVHRELAKLIGDPKFAPKVTVWGTTWIEDMEAFGKKASETMAGVQAVASQVFGQLDAIAAQSQKNKEIALDNEYQKRLETIKATITNEEEQRRAIEGLDAEYDIKRRSLQHAAAKQQKAASLAQAIINVAEGIAKALAQGGIFGPILAAAVAAMGAIQIKLIAQQPIPFREGNIFTRPTTLYTPAGRQVNVSENEPEILSPESKLRRIVQEELRAAGRGGGGGSITIPLYIDGKKVAEATAKHHEVLSARGRARTSVRSLVRREQ